MPRSSSFLLDWYAYRDKCFASFDTEESDCRVGLLEEYLSGLLVCLQERNRSRNDLVAKRFSLILADEAEERRFIEEDAHLLAHKAFNETTQQAIVDTVAELEDDARDTIEQEYVRFALQVTQKAESLGRKTIATELLDSVFLKLCQVQPQWMWRRLNNLLGDENATLKAARELVYNDESRARAGILREYTEYVADSQVALAAAEKQLLLLAWELPGDQTAQRIMEESSVRIQSAFRGWKARKAFRVM